MARRRIVRASSAPYYVQLEDILTAAIDAGRWRPGELLPSEAELTATYQISRTVIRKALDQLTQRGLVRRIKGKGTLVVERFRSDTSPELAGPYDALAATFRLHSVIENRLVEEAEDVRRTLGLDRAVPILHVVVISERSDRPGVPATLSSFDVAGDASPALAQFVLGGKTPRFRLAGPPVPVQLAQQFGLRLGHSPTTLSATHCTKSEAALLQIASTASIFCFEWVTFDVRGRAVITGRSLSEESHRLRFVVRHSDLAGDG
jgi:GntR family transcriptional regulator